MPRPLKDPHVNGVSDMRRVVAQPTSPTESLEKTKVQPELAPRLRQVAAPETLVSRGSASLWRSRKRIGAAAALLAILYFGKSFFLGPEVTTNTVIRRDLVRTVVASGHVETPYRVEIGSQITGTVKDVLVAEGDTVKSGQKLVILEDSEMKAARAQAQATVLQAEAKLRQLQDVVLPVAIQTRSQAISVLDNAQKAYDRAEKLNEDGHVSKAAFDEATKNRDIAQSQVLSAGLQVAPNQFGGSDYLLAEAQLNQAKASLNLADSRLDYASITAPRDGILISRNVERGTVVQAGKILMVEAPSGETQIILQIDEKNLGMLAVGQHAVASADAYPEKLFPAHVTYINPSVDLVRASVQVKLTVPLPPEHLRQDMTVSVDIEVANRSNTLVLPVQAVRDGSSKLPWVLAVSEKHARRQPVEVGLQGGGFVEILKGLKEDDVVIPTTVPGVSDGSRVRPRSRSANKV